MKGVAIVSKGLEDISCLEIKEILNVTPVAKQGAVVFDVKEKDLCLLSYKAQSLNRVLLLLDSFKIKKIDDIKSRVDKIDIFKWLKDKTFRVSCKVIDNEMTSEELNAKTGEFILEKIEKEEKYKQKVDLDNPDIIFFVYIFNEDCYLGIDFSSELHKRSYKIFGSPTSLRGTIAYSLLRIADVKVNEKIVDPFCGSGEIIIEAALFFSGFSVNYYDKDKFPFNKFIKFDFDDKFTKKKLDLIGYDDSWLYLNNAKKNAKIAGVNKLVSLSFSTLNLYLEAILFNSSVFLEAITTFPFSFSINSA